jgi:energy-coupling factor transporter transmembrane protein EcfT
MKNHVFLVLLILPIPTLLLLVLLVLLLLVLLLLVLLLLVLLLLLQQIQLLLLLVLLLMLLSHLRLNLCFPHHSQMHNQNEGLPSNLLLESHPTMTVGHIGDSPKGEQALVLSLSKKSKKL